METLESKDLSKRCVKMAFPKGRVIAGVMWTGPRAEGYFSSVY